VFLHGSPTPPDVLSEVASQLATVATTVVLSLPGYGGSPALKEPWTLADLHSAIEESLVAHRIARASFVGFSSGAYHALALACRGRVAADAVVSLAGFLGFEASERDSMREVAKLLRQGANLRALAGPRFLCESARSGERVASVEAWFDATSPENLAAEMVAFADAEDLTSRVAALDARVLARVGSHDVAAPPAKSEAIVRAATRGTLQVVPGAGHALPIEDRQATARAVLEFLRP
jgi:3-oxoadipate enol-lactonase/3-oxoadipate enol-lactonase/4-carboxymuconolactone decarboxylase